MSSEEGSWENRAVLLLLLLKRFSSQRQCINAYPPRPPDLTGASRLVIVTFVQICDSIVWPGHVALA